MGPLEGGEEVNESCGMAITTVFRKKISVINEWFSYSYILMYINRPFFVGGVTHQLT